MSFVTLGGEGSRPTFFELVAAERLMPSLKAAVSYSLSIFAQRRPLLNRLLDWEDELCALAAAVLDRATLRDASASFAESLYGLRRAGRPCKGLTSPALSRKEQRVTLLLLVGLPYLKAKLDALYRRHRRRTEAPLGLTFVRQAAEQQASGQLDRQPLHVSDFVQPLQAGSSSSATQRLRALALRLLLQLYPWVNAAQEGVRFAYQLLYLLDSTAFYTPILQLLGQRVVRVTGQEQVEIQVHTRRLRQQQLQGATRSRSWLLRLLHAAWLRGSFAFADQARNALILSVFTFKLLEWWFSSAEDKLGGTKPLPPPLPPPEPRPAANGLALPADPSICPICQQQRTNPAMAATSGYVYCYPCIFRAVEQQGCCPVTRIPCTPDQIRRLYQSA